MGWEVHYLSSDQQFCAPAADRSTAIAIACILLRDGRDVIKLESAAGEMIGAEEFRGLWGGDASSLVVSPDVLFVIFESLKIEIRPGHGPVGPSQGRHFEDRATEFENVEPAAEE
jgi:hypothetical protein